MSESSFDTADTDDIDFDLRESLSLWCIYDFMNAWIIVFGHGYGGKGF